MRMFKRGDIVKLNENGKNDKTNNEEMLVEVENAEGGVGCCGKKELACKGAVCNVEKGYAVHFTNRDSRCSEALELATDREAFLYHVAGLRERLE